MPKLVQKCGYIRAGSAAKYIGTSVKEIIQDS